MENLETISYIKIGNQEYPINAITLNGLTLTSAEKETWNNKQNALTFDSQPTANSDNIVTSGGIYSYMSGYIVTESTVSGWGFTKNQSPGTLTTTATVALSTATNEALSLSISLHKIAKTGTYSDLVGKPNLPVASYYNPANYTMYFFKSTEDRDSFIEDKTQTNLPMFSSEVSDYIEFKDSNVKSVLATAVGDGTGVTYARAKKQLSLSNVFKENTNISTFDEFKYFTGTGSLYYAFQGSSLKKITFPYGLYWGNVSSAWGLIFKDCTSLKEIDLADFTRQSAAYGSQFQVFSGCSSLTTLHFNSIEQINSLTPNTYYQTDVPFGYNNGAHKVYVKNDIFEDVLLTNLVIPETITSIRTAAFYRFNCITSLSLHPNVTNIGGYAFYQCTGLTSLDLSSVTTISQYAFYGCNKITSLTIPSTVTTIGQFAFYGCSGLTGDLELPSSVTSIAKQAFYGCSGLNSLTIPASVTQIATETITDAAKNGTVHVCGDVKATSGYQYLTSKHIIIDGNYTGYNTQDVKVTQVETIRIGGNLTRMNAQANSFFSYASTSIFCFFELMGTATYGVFPNTSYVWKNGGGGIIHLGYNGIAATPDQFANLSGTSKVYIGPGESQAGDQAILDLYLANSSWSSYASKLDLWYNYNGTYKIS